MSEGSQTTTAAMRGISKRRWGQLGQLLLDKGAISAEDLLEALKRQRDEDGYLGEILLEMGAVDQVQLYSLLAQQAGIPFVQLEPAFQDPTIAGIIPFGMIRKLRAIPLFKVEKQL